VCVWIQKPLIILKLKEEEDKKMKINRVMV
jgi:hypothetical protein